MHKDTHDAYVSLVGKGLNRASSATQTARLHLQLPSTKGKRLRVSVLTNVYGTWNGKWDIKHQPLKQKRAEVVLGE